MKLAGYFIETVVISQFDKTSPTCFGVTPWLYILPQNCPSDTSLKESLKYIYILVYETTVHKVETIYTFCHSFPLQVIYRKSLDQPLAMTNKILQERIFELLMRYGQNFMTNIQL